MHALRGAAAAMAALWVSACLHPASSPPLSDPKPAAPSPPPVAALTPPSVTPSQQPGALLPLSDLAGWAQEEHSAALSALQSSCGAAKADADVAFCTRLRALGSLPGPAARQALERLLRAQSIIGTGVLTGYFAPAYEARRFSDAEFSAPLRPPPPGLTTAPSAERAVIEARSADDALAWLRPEDLFFLQIQGSGVLTFPGATRMKALYAATNNQPFVAIARPMREQGLLAADNTSGEAIRAWLAAHRGLEAQAVMRLNPRYVFFTLVADDGREPAGAAGIPLTAGRSIAVDPAFHAYGEALWVSAEAPILAGAFPSYRRLVTALDTGGAIRGEVRADLYIGSGEAAGLEAGRIRHDLRLYRLVPAP